MLDFKSQEVKRHYLRHPRVLKMPAIVSFVSWVDGILFYSFFVSYLTSIFHTLTRDVEVPPGTSNVALSSIIHFVKDQSAMPADRLQARA